MLTFLLFSPLVGMVLVLLTPGTAVRTIRWIARASTGLTLWVSVLLWLRFDPEAVGVQFLQRAEWIPPLQIAYQVGIDGISLPLVMLTALLSFLACLGSVAITKREKEYYAFYQLAVMGILGTFVALDMFLFYVFWEVVLVSMYFLIGIWGGGKREYSAFKFLIFTLTGSLAILLALITLYLRLGTFDVLVLMNSGQALPLQVQQLLFAALFIGFAVKLPVFPLHTWLPDAHVDAPEPVSVLMAGVLLKMGAYGLLRFSFPILPDASQWFSPLLISLGAVNVVYAALCAMAQTDLKRMIAYTSISHMGFVLMGLASLTPDGLRGALFHMVSHGLIVAALFLMIGILYERAQTRSLDAFGGLSLRMPLFSGLLIYFCLASLGLPGLSGFIGEFLTLLGAFGVMVIPVVCAVFGIALIAAYHLYAIQRMLLGPFNQHWRGLSDIGRRELLWIVPLALLILVLGVYPLALLELQEESLHRLLTLMLTQ